MFRVCKHTKLILLFDFYKDDIKNQTKPTKAK